VDRRAARSRNPEDEFLVFEAPTVISTRFTYGEVKSRIERLARAVVTAVGIDRGDRVAILLPDSP
jgi:acyl-CoA synthetase (AMP-forming)/AMP-acid ligase II